jgi:hypothetical protein
VVLVPLAWLAASNDAAAAVIFKGGCTAVEVGNLTGMPGGIVIGIGDGADA